MQFVLGLSWQLKKKHEILLEMVSAAGSASCKAQVGPLQRALPVLCSAGVMRISASHLPLTGVNCLNFFRCSKLMHVQLRSELIESSRRRRRVDASCGSIDVTAF